jgi:hypothetical protein
MKVKVLKTFRDKVTGEMHKIGEEFTCTKKRYNEILSVDVLVEEIKEENEKKDEE